MSNEDRIREWRRRRGKRAAQHREEWLSVNRDRLAEIKTQTDESRTDQDTDPTAASADGPVRGARERAAALRRSAATAAATPAAAGNTVSDGDTTAQAAAAASPIPSLARSHATAELPLNRGLPTDESVGDSVAFARERRERLSRSRNLRILILVGVPLALFVIYTLLIVRPLYEATSVFTISAASDPSNGPQLSLGLGGPSPSLEEEYQMREYVTSREAMAELEREYGFVTKQASATDFLIRPGGLFASSDPLAFYRRRVEVNVNVQQGLARLEVRAADREDALKYSNALIAMMKRRVDEIADGIRTDQMTAIAREVNSARDESRAASTALARAQQARKEVDPVSATEGIYQIIGNFELRLSELRAQRDALLANGLDESPLLPRINAQIRTLEQQVARQREVLSGDSASSMQRSLQSLGSAQLRKQLADAALAASEQTLREARLQELRRRQYLILVAPPGVSEKPTVWAASRAFSRWLLALFIVALAGLAWQRYRNREEA